jgi:hypothetical protein
MKVATGALRSACSSKVMPLDLRRYCDKPPKVSRCSTLAGKACATSDTMARQKAMSRRMERLS